MNSDLVTTGTAENSRDAPEDGLASRKGVSSAVQLLSHHGPTRVVFVLRTVPPYRLPFLSELAKAVPSLKLTVVAATGVEEPGKLTTVTQNPAFHLIRVKARQREIWRFTLIWISPGPGTLRKLDPDVLVLEGSFGILSHVPLCLWARLRGRKVIFWVAGWSKPTTKGVARWVRELYMRAALRLGHRIVTYSSKGAEWLRHLGVPSEALQVVQNTIDVETIASQSEKSTEAASALREWLGIGDAPVMISVGALTPEKRLDRLLAVHEELWARGIRVHTVVVGDGPESATIATRARSLTGVHLVGGVVEGVEAYFSLGDLFVLPGLGGLAINQAMACGVPVLCTDADGTEADLVLDGVTGYYRPVFDCQEWADLAATILLNPSHRKAMGASARSHVLSVASLRGMCDSFASSLCSVLGLASLEEQGNDVQQHLA
jgi:glycosyltransferase involved in cell wall biosynthesis